MDRITTVEIGIRVVIVMIHVIVVVIHHDHRMIGKFRKRRFKWKKKEFRLIFIRNYDRRRRYSRSRSPVQHNKRDYRQRSRSASPK